MSSTKRLSGPLRQRQIAEAALKLISTRGVNCLTVAKLASEVGLSDGAIFRHFKNKDEIVDAAIDLFEENLAQSFPCNDGPPLERLGRFVVGRLKLVRKNPDLLRLAFNDRLVEATGEGGAGRVQELVARSLKYIQDCLSAAQKEGSVAGDMPSSILAWMIVGVVHGACAPEIQRATRRGGYTSASPQKVWNTLERVLRSTTQEKV